MSPQRRVLVVANRTADSPELIAALRQRCPAARLTLLVPAVPHGFAWAADMKAGWPEAIARAEAGAARMRGAGLGVEETIVGDPDPFAAAGDAIHAREFDELIVSTLPRGVSRWLRLDLPERLRRATNLPVARVTAHVTPVQAGPLRRQIQYERLLTLR
jgi:hypothetical protein